MDRSHPAAYALGLICLASIAYGQPAFEIVRSRAVDPDTAYFDTIAMPVILSRQAVESAIWQGATGERPFEVRTDPLPHGFRLSLSIRPVPEGRGVIQLRTAHQTHSIDATWIPLRLREAVKARRAVGRFRRTEPSRNAAAWRRGIEVLNSLPPDDPWVRAERGLLGAARVGYDRHEPELQTIATALAVEHPEVAAWLMRVVAQNLARLGLFSRAQHWARQSRQRSRHLGSAHIQASLDAQLSLWTGQLQPALTTINHALSQARRLGDDRRVVTYGILKSEILAGQGRHLEAVVLAESLRSSNVLAQSLKLTRDWHRLDAMRRCALPPRYDVLLPGMLADALDTNQPDWHRQITSLNGLLAATHAGDTAAADALVPVVRALNQTGPWVALGRLLIADHARTTGDWARAVEGYQAVLADADRRYAGVAIDETWQALHGLGRVAYAQGALGLAALFFDAALNALDEASRAATARLHRADWFADRRALVHDMLQVLLDLDLPDQAVAHLDRYRAPASRALLEDSRVARLDPQQATQWHTRIEAYERAQLAHAESVELCEGAAADDLRCAAQVAQTARGIAQQFDAAYGWLDRISPPLLAQDPPRLPPGTAALMVGRFQDASTCEGGWLYSALITTGGVEWSTPTTDPVAPWLSRLKAFTHVWLIGDHPALIALPQIPVDAPDGPVWGEIVGLSFAPNLAWLARTEPPPTGPAVAIVDPDGTIQRPMPAVNAAAARHLKGAAATRSATLEAIDGARWMVFDGHGVVDGDAWDAHLTLADGPLSLSDLLARRPRIGTAVLSGCESAVGARWSRTERLGLADGVLLAGARSVLATDIKVPVEDAARFVETFVKAGGLAQPGAGYRAAIRTLRQRGDTAWRHWRLFGRP